MGAVHDVRRNDFTALALLSLDVASDTHFACPLIERGVKIRASLMVGKLTLRSFIASPQDKGHGNTGRRNQNGSERDPIGCRHGDSILACVLVREVHIEWQRVSPGYDIPTRCNVDPRVC